MAELKTHKSRIGKGLINMLMFQMYGDEKLIYREYVQNARDAINDAVNHGILAYIIHSGFISGYQNRYGDNLKPPTNVYHRMTA